MAVWYFVFRHRYLRVYYCTTATVDSTVMQHWTANGSIHNCYYENSSYSNPFLFYH